MKVSVIIPVYNQIPYLAECLDSVLAQTLRDIEVVCVDDGSTDGSGRMLDEYAVRDSRIKVIHQANAGVGPARNTGMDAATGEFIAFMDPDDKYPDDGVLADLVRGAEENGVDVCGGSLMMMDGRSLGDEFLFLADSILEYSDYQFEFAFYRYVYRRRLVVEAGIRFPALVRFQDVPFCVEALHAAGRFYALKRLSYLYRDGHHRVEWSENGGEKALAQTQGMVMVHDLAKKYGYGTMANRNMNRLLDFVRLLCSESNGLQSDLSVTRNNRDAILVERDCLAREVEALRNETGLLRDEISRLKASESYRLGLFLTWPLRISKRILEKKT